MGVWEDAPPTSVATTKISGPSSSNKISSVIVAPSSARSAPPPRSSNGVTTIGGLAPACTAIAAQVAPEASRATRPTSNCCSTTTPNPANKTATTSTARTRRHKRRLRADSGSSGTSDGIGPSSTAADGCVARVAAVVRACGEISAARQLDPHRIVASFVGVVLGQAASQAARLDAHERIGLRVEIRRPAEYFYRNRVALQSFALTGQSLLDDEAQEIRGAGRLLEAAARENPFEPGTYLDRARLGRAGGRRGNVVCRVRNGDHRLVRTATSSRPIGIIAQATV